MARPIKSTRTQRFFKYLGLIAGGFGLMAMHYTLNPPEHFSRSGYKDTVFWIRFLYTDRGISTKPFGEGSHRSGDPFEPQTEKKL